MSTNTTVFTGLFRFLTPGSPLLLLALLAATTTTTLGPQQAHGATRYYTTPTAPYYSTSPTGSSSSATAGGNDDDDSDGVCGEEIEACVSEPTCLVCLDLNDDYAEDRAACASALGLDGVESAEATCDDVLISFSCCTPEVAGEVDCLGSELYQDFMLCYMALFGCQEEELACDATAAAEDSEEESLDEDGAEGDNDGGGGSEQDSTESAGNGAGGGGGGGLGYRTSTAIAFSSAFGLMLLPLVMRA